MKTMPSYIRTHIYLVIWKNHKNKEEIVICGEGLPARQSSDKANKRPCC